MSVKFWRPWNNDDRNSDSRGEPLDSSVKELKYSKVYLGTLQHLK